MGKPWQAISKAQPAALGDGFGCVNVRFAHHNNTTEK